MSAHQTFKYSGRCQINKQTLLLHTIECDKCEGDGKNFNTSIREVVRRWREQRNLSQWELAAIAKVPKSSVSKFETGQVNYGEAYIRKLVRVLSAPNADLGV